MIDTTYQIALASMSTLVFIIMAYICLIIVKDFLDGMGVLIITIIVTVTYILWELLQCLK